MRPAAFVVFAATAAALVGQGPYVPPAVSSGFTLDILTQALNQPVGLTFLPDGRLLVAEHKTAAIKVWTGGATVALVGTVPDVNGAEWENGLLAIEADPRWPVRPYLYAWYNSSLGPHLRLTMFEVTGDLVDPTSSNLVLGAAYHVLTDVPDNASIHNGGSLRFGPDGMLYVGSGDDATPCAAQDLDSLLGCVLRLDVNALPQTPPGPPPKAVLIPPGNPYQGPTDNARLVWCHGLRNPFRFHIDPLTGELHIADVGSWMSEEVNVAHGGENFGWPWLEANQAGLTCTGAPPQTVHPVMIMPHYSAVMAIMSTGRYRNVPNGAWNFGMAYEGDYFYLDFYGGGVRRIKETGNGGWAPAPAVPGQPNLEEWAVGFQTVADAAVGPDGALYFVKQYHTHFWGALGRVRGNPTGAILTIIAGDRQPGNAGRPLPQPLVVRLTDSSGSPVAGATVQFAPFVGGGSVDPSVATTDAQGLASTSYTLALDYTQPPRVLATSAGSSYAEFNLVWRGLTVTNAGPLLGYVTAEVRHSESNSPFTLAWEPPPPAPYASFSWGDVWTSVLSPMPGIGFADGLGLFGPPNPQFRTLPDLPYYLLTASGLPPTGGTTLVVQAYAVDTSLFPLPGSIMISNPQVVTLP